MKKEERTEEKQMPTVREVYRSSTTRFRHRRASRQSAGIIICTAAFLLIICISLFFILTGRSRVSDRKSAIVDDIDTHNSVVTEDSYSS